MIRRLLSILPYLMLFFLPPASISAPPPADSPAQPVLKTSTHEVVVDLVVTEGKGEAVNGLRKEQFQVFENGKPQTIDFFEEHSARTRPAGLLATPPKMPPNVYTNVPPAPLDDAVNVLLLDSLNTPPQSTTYARSQILGYLNNVKPGTRLAIVTLSEKLNIVQGFTTDAALLREVALKQTAPGISSALVSKSEIGDEQELEGFLSANGPAAAGGNAGGGSTAGGNGPSGPGWANPTVPMSSTTAVADGFANYQNYQSIRRTRMTLEAISDIARYLAAVPGRKNLIWFAGDFPVVIFPKFDQRMDDQDNAISLSQVRKAADLLTAARVAVYPVYANGMMSDDIISADNRSPGSAVGPSSMASMAGMDNYSASHDDRASLIAAMNQIASDTGGKAIYNTNDLNAAMTRAIDNGAHYYTLVYTPTNKKMDGAYRKIEVKTTAGKYNLAYRRGYNADDTLNADAKSAADPLHALMMRGMPSSTQVLYGVRVVPALPQPPPDAKRAGSNAKLTGPTTRYTVDFMIRWTDLGLAANADSLHRVKLLASLLAYDRDGNAVNWVGLTMGTDLKPDLFAAIQKSGVPIHLEIDLPSSAAYLETGVYDWASGKAGTLEVPIESAALASAAKQ